MRSTAMSGEEFDRLAELHCRRWGDASRGVVRSLLVDGKGLTEAAAEFGMSTQQAVVVRRRFLERIANGRVRADQFMQKVKPAGRRLAMFKDDIRQLSDRGYSVAQIAEFLKANKVDVSTVELTTYIGALNESSRPGEPKGRRR
jgi:hypothetical protein